MNYSIHPATEQPVDLAVREIAASHDLFCIGIKIDPMCENHQALCIRMSQPGYYSTYHFKLKNGEIHFAQSPSEVYVAFVE